MANRQRRTFTTEFKRESASLVADQGYSITEAQVKRLEQEKSILKKATGLLMSDEMNRMR